MTVEAMLFTNQRAPDPVRTQQIAQYMVELIDSAARRGDPELALNALLGAYMSIAKLSSGVSAVKAASALHGAGNQMLTALDPAAFSAGTAGLIESVQQMMARFNAVASGQPHHIVLSALLGLFRDGALANDCCTAACAAESARVSTELRGAAVHRDSSASVH